jgi:hypothetical protein
VTDREDLERAAFTEVTTHGQFLRPPEEYAEQVERWSRCGNLVAAVSQDYMCEPFALERTGGTVEAHQEATVERYDALRGLVDSAYVLPVLQGWEPADYARHVRMYGARLANGMWVGVGSVCKRNTNSGEVAAVLSAVLTERPDLRLHGFGLKVTALADARVRDRLHSADSMAWSYAARKSGRDANCAREAQRFVDHIGRMPVQEWMCGLDRPPATGSEG